MFDKPLYKFIDKESGLKSLDLKNIQFTKPSKLNDPLDCNEMLICLDKPESFKQKCFLEIMKDRDPSTWGPILKSHNRFDINTKFKEIVQEEKDSIGVCSFSKSYAKNSSHLLWSYYAQNHEGLCIEYNFASEFLSEKHFQPFEVNYEEDLKPVKLNFENNLGIVYWVLKKSDIWIHEEEIRLVDMKFDSKDDGYSRPKIPKDSITKIIFGVKSDMDFIKRVKTTLLKNDYNLNNILFEKMEICSINMKLIAESLDILSY